MMLPEFANPSPVVRRARGDALGDEKKYMAKKTYQRRSDADRVADLKAKIQGIQDGPPRARPCNTLGPLSARSRDRFSWVRRAFLATL